MSTELAVWAGALATLALYSILYRENSVYRAAEHIFIGLATGYGIYMAWKTVLYPQWWQPMVEKGQFSRDKMYAEIQELVAGSKPGRTHAEERIMIHTTGLVAHDVALAHHLYVQARETGRGLSLPAARAPE